MYFVRTPYLIRKLLPKAIWRMCDNEQKIYLTFDDGPIPAITPWVLALLKRENIKATFFCVGENAKRNPQLLQQIIDEGHVIGNHTYNHVNGWNLNNDEYLKNVDKCSHVVPSQLFRPPYGRIKKSQFAALSKDYKIIMWDVLSGDYDKNISPERCLTNCTKNIRNGSIIVFHDSYKAEKNLTFALPQFITYAKQNGFVFDVLK